MQKQKHVYFTYSSSLCLHITEQCRVLVPHMECNFKFLTEISILKISEIAVIPHQQNYASSPWQFLNDFY